MSIKARLERGCVVRFDGMWLVVVSVIYVPDRTLLHCICDNSNNSYSIEPKDCDIIMSARTAATAERWGVVSEEIRVAQRERPMPLVIMGEVLSGVHDNRWGADYE